jgi:diguanylate cyclase (GGDEF)-like protein/PAS domain S-box-containing protein
VLLLRLWTTGEINEPLRNTRLPSRTPRTWGKHWQEIKECGSLSFQSVRRTKDGEIFPVELTVNYVECGGREYNFSFARDITERRRMEQELAKSEEHFRALIENSSDLITVIGADGVIQFQSSSSERIVGYRPEELEGKGAFDFAHPEDTDTSKRVFAELLQKKDWESSQMLETRFRHKDGSWRTLEMIGKRLVGPTGELLCVLNSRDVTERKRAEKELAVEKEHLSLLNKAAVEMSHCLTASDVQKAGIRLACQATGAAGGVIWLLPSALRSRILGSEGLTRQGRLQLIRILRTSPALERVLGEQVPVQLTGAELTEGEIPDDNIFAGVLIAPVVSRGKVLGALCLATKPDHPVLSAAGATLAEGVAALVGVALENARLYDDAQYLAQRDPVTGLLNHRGINTQLEKELARSGRSGGSFAVVMMDLDNFKLFNDTYGHVVGDQVLQNVAAILEKSVRKADVVGRYGGDEFVALLPDTDAHSAVMTIDRIRTALRESGYVLEGGSAVPVFMSYGVATYPFDGRHASELLAAADANLYRSKRQGGDTITAPDSEEGHGETKSGVFTVLDGLVTTVDNKDHYTRKHSDDVCEQALAVASKLGLSSETQRCLRMAALLHDVGKIGIPDHILRKPGSLTEEEYEAIKQHVNLGELIINEIPNLAEVLGAVSATTSAGMAKATRGA